MKQTRSPKKNIKTIHMPLSQVSSKKQSMNSLPGRRKACAVYRSSHPEAFLVKGILKICHKFTEEHPCRSVISIKLLCNFIEITLRYGCSPVNLLHIFRNLFSKNAFGWLLLCIYLAWIKHRFMRFCL